MNFSRFQLWFLASLFGLILVSTALASVFVEQKNRAQFALRNAVYVPALADDQVVLPQPEVIVKRIEIDLSEQKMYINENDQAIREFVISSGKSRTPTPEGSFAINSKYIRAYSRPYRLYMPHWQAFIGSKYGIHGLPYRGRWIEGKNHLGTPVSHGCVRLSWEDAQWLYDWTEIGTTVDIHG